MKSNIEAIITQVKEDFKRYDVASMIDENSMYRDVVLAIRSFGNDITEEQDYVVDIQKGEGKMPDNFFSLTGAYKCEPLNYKTSGIETHELLESNIYVETIGLNSSWNECKECCEEQSMHVMKKSVYVNHGKVEFRYHSPSPLRLAKTFKRNMCAKGCSDKFMCNSPYEINIFGDKMQANFNEGSVYITYYGLPTDEEGNLELPDTRNGNLEKYIEYHLKVGLCERLMTSSENVQGLATLFSLLMQKEGIYLTKARQELKMRGLDGGNLTNRLAEANRQDMERNMFTRTR